MGILSVRPEVWHELDPRPIATGDHVGLPFQGRVLIPEDPKQALTGNDPEVLISSTSCCRLCQALLRNLDSDVALCSLFGVPGVISGNFCEATKEHPE